MIKTTKKRSKQEVNQRSKQNDKKVVYFTLISYIEKHNKLPMLDISKQSQNRYLKFLKESRLIKRVAYGVWELLQSKEICFDYISKEVNKRSKPNGGVTPSKKGQTSKQNDIRGHNFMFKIDLPKIQKWKERKTFLEKNEIRFASHKTQKSQMIELRSTKIFLYDKCIILYYIVGKDFWDNSAKGSRQKVIYETESILKTFENLFRINIKIRGQYKLTLLRQHYAKVGSEFAKYFEDKKIKIDIKGDDGKTWLLVDKSWDMFERETVHSKRADIDNDKIVAPFLNGLRTIYDLDQEPYTPQKVMEIISNLSKTLSESLASAYTQIELNSKTIQVLLELEKSNTKKLEEKNLIPNEAIDKSYIN